MSHAMTTKSVGISSRRVCWAILMCSFLALVPIQKQIDSELGFNGKVAEMLYVPSGRVLRRLSLGHEGLLADIYWTRAVQYYGRGRMEDRTHYELLGPLLRITTTLDPHLLIAYRFGAIFLTERMPGQVGQPEEAVEIIRRGIVANPDYWRLWADLGFIYYWNLKDYKTAARIYMAGSERPGAAVWMKVMAATIAAKGGQLETSYTLWSQIYQNAGNDSIRKSAEQHLAAIIAAGQLAALDSLLDKLESQTGHKAGALTDLITAGFLRGLPKDPSGVPYVLGPDGRAVLSARSEVEIRLAQ